MGGGGGGGGGGGRTMEELWLGGADRSALAGRIVQALTAEDYVSAIFVDDALGPIPATLPFSA